MKIHEIIAQVTADLRTPANIAPNFEKGWKYWANLNFDELLNHVVWLHWPCVTVGGMSGGKFTSPFVDERYRIGISFLEKSELDYTPEQHQPLIDRQREQYRKFMANLSQRSDVVSVSNIRAEDVINVFDVNLTGVLVAFDVKIIDSVNVC